MRMVYVRRREEFKRRPIGAVDPYKLLNFNVVIDP
jgi:hypothetical protein